MALDQTTIDFIVLVLGWLALAGAAPMLGLGLVALFREFFQ